MPSLTLRPRAKLALAVAAALTGLGVLQAGVASLARAPAEPVGAAPPPTTQLRTLRTTPGQATYADDRLQPYAFGNAIWRDRLAESSLAVVEASTLVTSGQVVTIAAPTLAERLSTCADEPFAGEPTAAVCSGTLIDDDLVLTAGHCTRVVKCPEFRAVFGYAVGADGRLPALSTDDVYACRSVLAEKVGDTDYALVRLDRAVVGRRPAKLRLFDVAVDDAEPLIFAAHPSGLPRKISESGRVLDARAQQRDFFLATLDSFPGSSGAGVFSKTTGELVGSLIGGIPGQRFGVQPPATCARAEPIAQEHARDLHVGYAARAVAELCRREPSAALCPCGDHACTDERGETSRTCPADCGTRCGDGACNGRENGTSCYEDCGRCGNEVCEAEEAKRSSCCADCGCSAGSSCQSAVCGPVLGNVNGDESVDARDVAAVAAAMRSDQPPSAADVDCDGQLTARDATLLQQHISSRSALPCRTLTALSAGARHTCALLASGHVRCFGENESGQLGTSAAGPVDAERSAVLRFTRPVTALATGTAHSCALLDDGTVRCWGRGGSGQLGYGDAQDRKEAGSVPAVPLGGSAVAVAAGGDHTCAVLEGGGVRCWGDNSRGQLGLGNTEPLGDDELPTAAASIPLGSEARALGLGLQHTCVTFHDGKLRCFGANGFGQLGLGHRRTVGDDESITEGTTLVQLPEAVVGVAASALNTCVVLRSGKARCWGDNRQSQLGYGGAASLGAEEPPSSGKEVPLPSSARTLVAGTARQCAIMQDGRVACWGRGTSALSIVLLPGPATLLASGANHTCALTTSGALLCWGANDKGQLGLDMSRYQELRPEELQRRTTQVALFGTNARLAAGPRRGW
jgi:alpha-tubulin suppressor-like RCC1 family protein